MSNEVYPQKIIVICGQTATGKSDLAVFLAKKFRGEIVSADSRQVYRGLNLGSGKITKKEMLDVPHYLLDVASPKRRFSAAQYKNLAQAAIKKIRAKNKLPIICGGTAFYIYSLADNFNLPPVKPNFKLRARLEKKSPDQLFAMLKKIDPRRASAIDPKNPRRLIRALEIVMTTGQVIPTLKKAPTNNVLFLGLKKEPAKLAQRIKARLEKRLKQGMLGEVKKLRRQGLSWKKLDDFGLEYRWLARYLQNKLSYPEMVVRLQKDIEHFAKRQLTWFRQDQRIIWIENYSQAAKKVRAFLSKDADR